MSLSLRHRSTFAGDKSISSIGLASNSPATPLGIVSEVVYREETPRLTHFLLLPLLRELGEQSRWQLWLTPQHKLNRQWLATMDLPIGKIMQAQFGQRANTLTLMEKALLSGNFSVVIWWAQQPLTSDEHQRLNRAAKRGNAVGLLMRPECVSKSARPLSGLKIHSDLYH